MKMHIRFCLCLYTTLLFGFFNIAKVSSGEASALSEFPDWHGIVIELIDKSGNNEKLSFDERNKLAGLAVYYAKNLQNDTLYVHALINHSQVLVSQGYYDKAVKLINSLSIGEQKSTSLFSGLHDVKIIAYLSGITIVLFFIIIVILFKKNQYKKESIKNLENFVKEKEKTTKALKISEGKFYSLLRTLNEGFVYTDIENKILFLNEKACNIFGGLFDDLLNRSLEEFVQDKDDLKIFKEKQEFREKGIADQYDLQIKRADGQPIWVSFSESPLFDDTNRWIGSVMIISDITQRKKYDESMKELTASLNRKIKQLNCLYDIYDLTSIPGITFEEIFEKSLSIIPFGLKYTHDACVEIVFENQVFHSDNFKKTEWSYTVPLKVQKKKLGHLFVCYTEEKPFINKDPFHFNEKLLIKNIAEKLGHIIESKNMEKMLKENEQKLSVAQKIAKIGDWEWDLMKDEKSFSDSFFEVMGIPLEKKIFFDDEMFFKMVYPSFKKQVQAFFDNISKTDFSELDIDFKFVLLNGKEKYISMTGKVIGDNHEIVEKLIFTVQDITIQRETKKKVKQS